MWSLCVICVAQLHALTSIEDLPGSLSKTDIPSILVTLSTSILIPILHYFYNSNTCLIYFTKYITDVEL